ncbi:hypothetical protein BZA77DRAFT_69684 [Pyronema omphalodes]|nr:hypothetical protein BZA77DRAFT_69684 [Pyronema omphalodes]
MIWSAVLQLSLWEEQKFSSHIMRDEDGCISFFFTDQLHLWSFVVFSSNVIFLLNMMDARTMKDKTNSSLYQKYFHYIHIYLLVLLNGGDGWRRLNIRFLIFLFLASCICFCFQILITLFSLILCVRS